MENKWIVFWNAEPHCGRTTLAKALASQLAAEGRTVLIVYVAPDHLPQNHQPTHEPSIWVPRFKRLSPILLRNYLNHEPEGPGRLNLPALPSPELRQDLFAVIRQAFEWIFWLSPVNVSPDALAVLDQADGLLWTARSELESLGQLRHHIKALAAVHIPHAFSNVVINHVPASIYAPGLTYDICPGTPVLTCIPHEQPPGIAYRQSTQKLLHILKARKNDVHLKSPSGSIGDATSSDALIENIKTRITPQVIEALNRADPVDSGLSIPRADVVAQKTLESCLAQDAALSASREQRQDLYLRVLNEVLGLGPIEPLLKDPDVSEVMVNGPGAVFVEKKGKLYAAGVQFSSDAQLRTVIDRIVAPLGRRVDESMPLCDARLADGSRVNIVLPPLAIDGPTLTIRKFMARSLTLQDLTRIPSLSPDMADFLSRCVRLRKNMVVSGGTGSGKTTLLNALSGLIPDDERIVTIEDAAELRLQKPHVVRLESRPPNAEGEGTISIRRLVINALRMRPDRIVVGECRGGEALDMLQAMNTGHEGSLTTVHANSPRDALRRLETLVLMAGMDLPVRVIREQIQSAVDVVIQQSRCSDGSRKVVSITEVTGLEGDTLTLQELFRFRSGIFEKTGMTPTFHQELAP